MLRSVSRPAPRPGTDRLHPKRLSGVLSGRKHALRTTVFEPAIACWRRGFSFRGGGMLLCNAFGLLFLREPIEIRVNARHIEKPNAPLSSRLFDANGANSAVGISDYIHPARARNPVEPLCWLWQPAPFLGAVFCRNSYL